MENTISLREVATGKQRLVIPVDKPRTLDFWKVLAVSPDGRFLAAGAEDKLVRLWDTATGETVAQLTGHDGPVVSLAFADGKALISGSADSTALLWTVPHRPKPMRTLTAAEVDRLWDDLQADDAVKAYQAVCTLSADPARTVARLRQELRPAPVPDAKRIARLIADLDSNQFEKREQANHELEMLGKAAEPTLRQALAGDLPVEVRRRLERVLARPEAPPATPDGIRSVRAVEVLERIGTPEAKELLRTLANGAAGHWLTREAKATLERLDRTESAKP